MKNRGQKTENGKQSYRSIGFYLVPLAFSLFLGCGSSVTGTNTALDVSHRSGPDCTQSGCHPGFGAGGTVFDSAAGTTPAAGKIVKIKSVETGSEISLTTDSLGNFHYNNSLSGYYNMSVDGKAWSSPHSLPERKSCNTCHTWPPANGAGGRLF